MFFLREAQEETVNSRARNVNRVRFFTLVFLSKFDVLENYLIWSSMVSGAVPISIMAESFRPMSFSECPQ